MLQAAIISHTVNVTAFGIPLTSSPFCFRFIAGFIYYGLFLVSEYLSGNIYKDFALMAFVEIPANFLAILSLRRCVQCFSWPRFLLQLLFAPLF